MDKCPLYRLHWITRTVTAAFAGILAFHQVIGFRCFSRGIKDWWLDETFFAGWPLQHTMWNRDNRGRIELWIGPEVWSIAVDLLCSIAAVASVAFVFQRITSSRMQFGLSTLLSSVAVIAVVLLILPGERLLVFGMSTSTFWKPRPLVLSVPMACGIAATVYTAGWLATQLIVRLYRLGRRTVS